MSFKLSHSSYGRYVTCPKSFELHYIQKLRPISGPSHLIFGSAIDAGLNAMVSGKDEPSPISEFDRVMTDGLSQPIEFHASDYDRELIDEETRRLLREECSQIAGIPIEPDSVAHALIGRSPGSLSSKQRQVLSKLCFASMRAKAILIFEAYKTKVLPQIKKVVSSQKEIRWTDKHGNDFVGVLDLVIDLEGHGEIPADNKTASRPYEQDSVSRSTQLALYSKVTGKDKAAFIVMDKTIRKNRIKICSVCGHDGSGGRHKTCDSEKTGSRCGGEWNESIRPEASIQIIVDNVSAKVQDLTLEALSETAQVIKAGYFPRNLNACDNQYGRPCPYREYCWRGDSTGLRTETSKGKK
jgi:hypothetical protein